MSRGGSTDPPLLYWRLAAVSAAAGHQALRRARSRREGTPRFVAHRHDEARFACLQHETSPDAAQKRGRPLRAAPSARVRAGSTARCGVEQEVHWRASHAPRALDGRYEVAGDSPTAPHRAEPRAPGSTVRGGTTSASGLPKRVTRRGRPGRRTRSSAARQVALNLETAISSMSNSGPWSRIVALWPSA